MITRRHRALTSWFLTGAACVLSVPKLACAQSNPAPGSELVVPPPSVWSPPPATAPAPPAPTTVEGPARVPLAWHMASEAPPMPTTMVKDTYSAHVLLADGLAFGTMIVGAKYESPAIATVGFVGYFAGGPIVHGLHGRGATAGASVGLRVLTPIVGALTFAGLFRLGSGGSENSCNPDGLCDTTLEPAAVGLAVGGVLGFIAAPILDATLLARKEWFNKLPLVPAVALNKGGGTVTVGGVF